MALSGNFFTTYYAGWRNYEFIWEAEQTGNRSTVTWELYARGQMGTTTTATLWSLFLDLTVSKGTLVSSATTVTADNLVSGSISDFANNGQGKTSDTTAELYHLDYIYSVAQNRYPRTNCKLATGIFVIDHTASGDGAFSVNLKTATYGNTYYQTGSGSYTLDATAVKSTIAVNGTPKMGEKPSFTINRITATITHNLRYELKNKAGQVVKSGSIANGVGISYNGWTIPKDLATGITDSDYGTMVVYCTSINGGKTVGETSCQWKCYVSDDAYPSVSIALSDGARYLDKIGYYLQNYSKVVVTATSAGKYGSTIKQISTTVNGKTYSGSPVTLPAFATAKSYEITTKVVDSRGREATDKETVTITPYTIPTMTLSAYRCKSQDDSTRDDSGAWAKITVSGNVAEVNGNNTGLLNLSATGYAEEVASLSGAFTKSVIIPASTAVAIPISAELTDTVGAVPSKVDISLQAGFAIMEIYKDGHGVSFGEECAGHGFSVGMDAVFRKSVSLEQSPTESDHAVNKGYVDRALVEDSDYPGCYYRMVNGIKEWLNPPMVEGGEYRTTQRCGNAPIYMQTFKFAVLPNKGRDEIYTGIRASQVLSIEGVASNNSYKYPLPMMSDGIVSVYVLVDENGHLYIRTMEENYSGWSAQVTLRYIKP